MNANRFTDKSSGTLRLWRRVGPVPAQRQTGGVSMLQSAGRGRLKPRVRKLRVHWCQDEWQKDVTVSPVWRGASTDLVATRRIPAISDLTGSLLLVCAYGAEALGPDWHRVLNNRRNPQKTTIL